MKRTFFLSLLGMLLLMGCQKDNIVTIDTTVISESGNDITNTTFTQTVYVTFSGNDDALVTGTKLKSYTKETGIQVWLGAGYEFAF